MAVVIPDVLPDVKAWLKTHPDLQPLHNGRVFFRIPDDKKIGGFPIMRLYRVSGGVTGTGGGDAPISQIDLALECWGNTFNMYPAVRQLAVAVESAVWQVTPGVLLNPAGQTRALTTGVSNVLDAPDPDSGWPRLVVDTRWTFLPL